jgi:hypothetical protein
VRGENNYVYAEFGLKSVVVREAEGGGGIRKPQESAAVDLCIKVLLLGIWRSEENSTAVNK